MISHSKNYKKISQNIHKLISGLVKESRLEEWLGNFKYKLKSSESEGYLRSYQTPMTELSAKEVNVEKSLIIFAKKHHHRCLIGS